MTPDEIAREIVAENTVYDTPPKFLRRLRIAIAAAITAERERAEKAEAERDRLREALEPFMWGSDKYDDILWGGKPDSAPMSITTPLKLGQYRRARAAYRKMAVDPRCDEIGTGKEPKDAKG
jgi:hypothetical protein